MKIECPVCGIQGHLQQRGNSVRVQHYIEYTGGKRKYQYHRITGEHLESLEVNGSKTVEVNNYKIILKSQKPARNNCCRPGSIVRSSISGCRPLDPGSKPGQGATISLTVGSGKLWCDSTSCLRKQGLLNRNM